MPIPDYQSLMLPVLLFASNGEVRISAAVEELAKKLGLTPEERSELLPSGRQTTFSNRVHWAKTYMAQAGLLENTRRGHFKITARGRQVLDTRPDHIDNTLLAQFNEFQQFRERGRAEHKPDEAADDVGDLKASSLSPSGSGPETISVNPKWAGAAVLKHGRKWDARALPITTFEGAGPPRSPPKSSARASRMVGSHAFSQAPQTTSLHRWRRRSPFAVCGGRKSRRIALSLWSETRSFPRTLEYLHMRATTTAEQQRLAEAEARKKHWKRWGPYLAERAWGTVREDYSSNGDAWEFFPHDHARSRVYRWTEDGILGICDNHQYLCFALAMWNGKDCILKERLYGLTGPQGNHGEDVKEIYYYLDATPTNSYLKGLYKYPQAAYPYERLQEENRKRTRQDPEFEIEDTGIFNESRYFDVFAEYAKNDVDDILIRITVANRGPDSAQLILLPTLWFRNIWDWDKNYDPAQKPRLFQSEATQIEADHPTLGRFTLALQGTPDLLFTENESNTERLWNWKGQNTFYKDAFHDYLIDGRQNAVNPQHLGTKACAVYSLSLGPRDQAALYFRLSRAGLPEIRSELWPGIFDDRIREASEFYARLSQGLSDEARQVQRQAFAGMFWTKQYYHFVVETWLEGDNTMPKPPEQRKEGRDHKWRHLFNEDVISMPDKWEYPWYAAWDLAFHAVAIAPADPDFPKAQLSLFLREWYMHPNGQIPAYEWAFGDVNPPVHAWAAWRVFKIDQRIKGRADYEFLERVFLKLLMNFTWWVNRKDSSDANIFEGGFLGLDNIGIFDRNTVLPYGWMLEQSDGTSWMAMYCLNMLKIALHLATVDVTYEDIASKFFEHFLYISYAVNHSKGTGLWDEEDGFYYDRLRLGDDKYRSLRVRSLVGLVPLFATDTLDAYTVEKHPGFKKRMEWFIDNRPDLTSGLASMTLCGIEERRLLSVVNRPRLERILQRVFDENEFLSPFGVRSLSRFHKEHPYTLEVDGARFQVDYEPGESTTGLFGGNSNWRGPVWFPGNFLLIEALQRLQHYFGESFTVEFPARSGKRITLDQAARQLSLRLSSLFLPDANGHRPEYDGNILFQNDPNFRCYPLFYEYFDGDTGKGLGASHQTGWTGVAAKLLQQSGG